MSSIRSLLVLLSLEPHEISGLTCENVDQEFKKIKKAFLKKGQLERLGKLLLKLEERGQVWWVVIFVGWGCGWMSGGFGGGGGDKEAKGEGGLRRGLKNGKDGIILYLFTLVSAGRAPRQGR